MRQHLVWCLAVVVTGGSLLSNGGACAQRSMQQEEPHRGFDKLYERLPITDDVPHVVES